MFSAVDLSAFKIRADTNFDGKVSYQEYIDELLREEARLSIVPEPIVEEKIENFTCKIQKIDPSGEVFLDFSTVLRDTSHGVNLTDINSTVLELSVMASNETTSSLRQQFPTNSTEELVSLKEWKAVALRQSRLILKIEFKNPLLLS